MTDRDKWPWSQAAWMSSGSGEEIYNGGWRYDKCLEGATEKKLCLGGGSLSRHMRLGSGFETRIARSKRCLGKIPQIFFCGIPKSRDSHTVRVNPQYCCVGLLTDKSVPTQSVGMFTRARHGAELPYTRYCAGGKSIIKTDTS